MLPIAPTPRRIVRLPAFVRPDFFSRTRLAGSRFHRPPHVRAACFLFAVTIIDATRIATGWIPFGRDHWLQERPPAPDGHPCIVLDSNQRPPRYEQGALAN